MCGIIGLYKSSPVNDNDWRFVENASRLLAHRGPDGDGVYRNQNIAFAHRRLSIIDLETGQQPISNKNNTAVLIFNGEIYNYREVRADLVARGYEFSTHTDTEVIVHLYEEYGVDCLAHLNGMFAFALWDDIRKRLFIARDRFGEKPLYYQFREHQNGEQELFFASELKAISNRPGFNPDVNLNALDDYLSYGYIPVPHTIFNGVQKLPAAHYLLIGRDFPLRIERYWYATISESHRRMSEHEAIGRFKDLLEMSVRLRLRSDVPLGAFLSGGIDSSLIVAMAAQQSGSPLSTYSIGLFGENDQDIACSRLVAEQYGTDHHEIMLDEIDLGLFPDIVSHLDEPFADPSIIPTYFVTQAAAKDLKVMLSGDGGDELFGGYRVYQFEPGEQLVGRIPNRIRKLVFNSVASLFSNGTRGKGILRRYAEAGHILWQRKCGVFDPFERLRLLKEPFADYVDQDAWLYKNYFNQAGLDATSQRMLADQNTYLTDDILVKVDRVSMWHSLEVRVPLLDHHLVEFANSLPLNFKCRDGVQKYLPKQLLHTLVPEKLITQKKRGFGLPISNWLSGRYYDYSRDLLLASDAKCTEYLNQDVIEEYIHLNKVGKRDLSRRIWALMCLEQWLRGC